MLAVARGSHSCAAEIDLGTTTPRKKPGPENLGSGDETRELHKTRVFHQIFNAADGPEKSGFRACLTEIRPKPPSINPQTRKKSHNQNPGFARKTQVTHSPIPGLSRVSPRSRVFPGCLCCVLWTPLMLMRDYAVACVRFATPNNTTREKPGIHPVPGFFLGHDLGCDLGSHLPPGKTRVSLPE